MPVSKKGLKAYDCKNLTEYFDIIVASKVNGNSHQCAEQFKALGRDQRKECLIYLAGSLYENGGSKGYYYNIHAAIGICIESIY